MILRASTAAAVAFLVASSASAATMKFEWLSFNYPAAAIEATGEIETSVEDGDFAAADVTAFSFAGKVTFEGDVYTFSYSRSDVTGLSGNLFSQSLLFDDGATYLYDGDGNNIGTIELMSDNGVMGGYATGLSEETQQISGLFNVTAVEAGEANGGGSAVPEPATWGMMLLGFGTMGAALRRRRNVTVRFA